VVEDDHQICELLTSILEDAGLDVRCVNSDREAYATLGKIDFAALVVDINLGAGTTGYDVARFARQVTPGLPTIYISGQSSEASFSAFGVPGSIFLQKPFKSEDLLSRLEGLLDPTRAASRP
jgi:DNA-binding response OmpR family regulator